MARARVKHMYKERNEQSRKDFEQECENWDWVRPAGVSPRELKEALRNLLTPASAGATQAEALPAQPST